MILLLIKLQPLKSRRGQRLCQQFTEHAETINGKYGSIAPFRQQQRMSDPCVAHTLGKNVWLVNGCL